MDDARFESLVSRAIEGLPDEFAESLENIDIVIQDRPTPQQRRLGDVKRGFLLLGLYEGIPLTERGYNYGLVPPDKITIFQHSIEEICGGDEAAIEAEVVKTLRHEVAHYFGISDARLEELERGKADRHG